VNPFPQGFRFGHVCNIDKNADSAEWP
jgi:hypothetical protein